MPDDAALMRRRRREEASTSHWEPKRPNPYPHRLSVDVDDATYRALRFLAAERGCSIVEIVRAGIAKELFGARGDR